MKCFLVMCGMCLGTAFADPIASNLSHFNGVCSVFSNTYIDGEQQVEAEQKYINLVAEKFKEAGIPFYNDDRLCKESEAVIGYRALAFMGEDTGIYVQSISLNVYIKSLQGLEYLQVYDGGVIFGSENTLEDLKKSFDDEAAHEIDSLIETWQEAHTP